MPMTTRQSPFRKKDSFVLPAPVRAPSPALSVDTIVEDAEAYASAIPAKRGLESEKEEKEEKEESGPLKKKKS